MSKQKQIQLISAVMTLFNFIVMIGGAITQAVGTKVIDSFDQFFGLFQSPVFALGFVMTLSTAIINWLSKQMTSLVRDSVDDSIDQDENEEIAEPEVDETDEPEVEPEPVKTEPVREKTDSEILTELLNAKEEE